MRDPSVIFRQGFPFGKHELTIKLIDIPRKMHVLASFLAVYQSIDLFYSRDQEQELLTKAMNDFQVSPHGAFKRGQQFSQSCPRTLNDNHEFNAFLTTSLQWLLHVLNSDFSRGRAHLK